MIEVCDVSKNFGGVVALSHVTLSIERGARVAFVGPNGSGKTTLLRALLGLICTTGTITIGGTDVAVDPVRALRHVAYIPQVAPPTDALVRDVVFAMAALRSLRPERIAEHAALLGMSLEACATKRFAHLSGGMKQKLLAAAALAADAPILIGDEPTANLDAEARGVFFERLAREHSERVLILCSHRADELRQVTERLVEFRDGRVERDTARPVLVERTSGSSCARVRRAC